MLFTIPGKPQGKMRPRYARKTGVMYTPAETVHYEKKVRDCFRIAGGEKIRETKKVERDGRTVEVPQAIKVEVWAFIKPAESAPKWKRELMLQNTIKPTKKPDADNIGKIILDALNGLAYEDDKQVTELVVHKAYSETRRVTVGVSEI